MTYNYFRFPGKKLGEKEAEALVSFVDNKIKESNENNLRILTTKEDLASIEGKLETKIEAVKSDIIRWEFGFS